MLKKEIYNDLLINKIINFIFNFYKNSNFNLFAIILYIFKK